MSEENSTDKKLEADKEDYNGEDQQLNDKFIVKNHKNYESSDEEQNEPQVQNSNRVDDSLERALADMSPSIQKDKIQKVQSKRGGRGNRGNVTEEKNIQEAQKVQLNESGALDNNQDSTGNNEQSKKQSQKRPSRGREQKKQVQEQTKVNPKKDESNWDDQVKEQKTQNKRSNQREKKEEGQLNQLQPDKVSKQKEQEYWGDQVDQNAKEKEKEKSETRGGRGNRGNRQTQNGSNQGRNQQQNTGTTRGNRERNQGFGNGQRSNNGFNDNRNHQAGGQSWNRVPRDYNNDNRGRGGYRANDRRGGREGGFKGDRQGGYQGGQHGGNMNRNGDNFNRDGGNFRRNQGNRVFEHGFGGNQQNNQNGFNQQNQNPQDGGLRNSNASILTLASNSLVRLIEPKGDISWPQISLYVRKCKVSLTLRNIGDHEADCLIFPFQDLNFKMYPSTLICRTSKYNYRKRIQEKINQGHFNKSNNWIKKCDSLGAFKYVSFLKFSNEDVPTLIPNLIAHTYNRPDQKMSSFVFPICSEMKDFSLILNTFCECLYSIHKEKSFINSVHFTTKDPQYFKKCQQIFMDKINADIDQNRVYLE